MLYIYIYHSTHCCTLHEYTFIDTEAQQALMTPPTHTHTPTGTAFGLVVAALVIVIVLLIIAMVIMRKRSKKYNYDQFNRA